MPSAQARLTRRARDPGARDRHHDHSVVLSRTAARRDVAPGQESGRRNGIVGPAGYGQREESGNACDALGRPRGVGRDALRVDRHRPVWLLEFLHQSRAQRSVWAAGGGGPDGVRAPSVRNISVVLQPCGSSRNPRVPAVSSARPQLLAPPTRTSGNDQPDRSGARRRFRPIPKHTGRDRTTSLTM